MFHFKINSRCLGSIVFSGLIKFFIIGKTEFWATELVSHTIKSVNSSVFRGWKLCHAPLEDD